MAICEIVYWKDIPSFVQATEGAQAVVAELEGRFSEFQKSGLGGS